MKFSLKKEIRIKPTYTVHDRNRNKNQLQAQANNNNDSNNNNNNNNNNNRNFSATFRHLRRQLFGNSSANLWLSHKQATDLEPSTASSKK